MKLRNTLFLLYGFVLMLSTNLYASNDTSSIRVEDAISIKEGLAHNGVSTMIKDSRGYLWIGTYDGLNRYNGKDVTIYKNRVDSKIFQSNRIRAIIEDRLGRFWVGTDEGVTLFDYNNHDFRQLTEQGSVPICKIFISKDGSSILCVAESGSIFIYDMSGELLRCDELPRNCFINDAIYYQENIYVLASRNGLIYYDSAVGKCRYFDYHNDKGIRTVAKYNDNSLLVAYNNGMCQLDIKRESGRCEIINSSPLKYDGLQISSLNIDANGALWICSDINGLYVAQGTNSGFSPKLTTIIDGIRISSTFFEEGITWVSTLDDGVIRLSTQKSKFENFTSEEILLPQIKVLDDDRIIISNTSKLTVYNTKTNREESLPFNISASLQSQYNIVAKDNKNNLWIISKAKDNSTELYRVDGSKAIKIDSYKLTNLTHGKIYSTSPIETTFDGDGNLWIAYVNNVVRVSFKSENEIYKIESIWDNQSINDIGEISRPRVLYYDAQTDLLWLGTNKRGLFRLDLKSSKGNPLPTIKIDNYRHEEGEESSLSANFVSSIMRTKSGVLWVGTEQGGLCRVTESGDDLSFETLSEKNGLSNNVVKSIQEDSAGNLWIGTNIGLNNYNVSSDNFIIYRSEEGLPFEDFWYTSTSLIGEELIFTGTHNILTFEPDAFYSGDSQAKIYFDKLIINNQEISPNQAYDGRVVLNHRLLDGDVLNLRYNENVFSIAVDVLCDQHTQGHTLHYKLETVSDNWIKLADNNNIISFNGIEYGHHKLLVCTYNSRGERSKISTLNIVIPPPVWKSTFAYIMYVVFFIIVVFATVYGIMLFQSLSHKLEIHQLEQSVHKDKLRYFSNISHELKTPLSLILAPVALLSDRFKLDSEVISKLNIIKRQSKKLLELIDLTHGVEANDLKTLKTSRTLYSFDNMIRDLTLDFKFITEYDNKIFDVNKPDAPVAVNADRGMIEKIVNNLLSNALKHTVSGDKISLSYVAENDKLILKVADSGNGIDAEDLPHIFERFYQAKRSGGNNIGGTGIGLTFSKMLVELHDGVIEVESEIGVGTTFTITLPIVADEVVEQITSEVQENLLCGEIINDYDSNEIIIESEYSSSTIFLVDDNQELRSLLTEIIGRHFSVKSFANGLELIEQLDNEWPDLIVSDIMMPEIDGYEVCRRVKGDIKTSHIPVILLTACSTIDDHIKGVQVGADAYIAKPFYPKHLVTRIEALLHNRQQLRERFQVGIPLVYGKESNTSAKDNEFMHQLYELFNENLSNEEIDLEHIAHSLGQNRSMFFKKVKAITNTSPYELLKDYRIKKAAEMLQSGEYNVSEVCMLTGFKGRSHFSRVFKEKYNVAPSKYAPKSTQE